MLGHVLEGWSTLDYGRSRDGVPLRCFVPEGNGRVAGLLTATLHGEEADTGLLARRLLERVRGSESRWAVVPVANPDGLLAGTRQNAGGVDINRNFPAATWQSDPSFTYPPGIEPERRVPANRQNRSSPGERAGSEPETQALIALCDRLRPPLVLDLHSPLELVLVRRRAHPLAAERLAAAADMPLRSDLDAPCPGAFDDWLAEQEITAIVYEIEHAGLPDLCSRHLPGLEALLRGEI
jgi:protein MpaA